MSWAPFHTLGDLCEVSHGSTPSKSETRYWGGDLPWVSPKDMQSDILVDTEDHLTPAASAEARAPIAPPGSILIVVRSGILVRRLPVALATRTMSFNQDIKTLIPDTAKVRSKYVLRFLQSRAPEVLISGVKKGATVHSVVSGYIESLRLPVPPTSEQDRIVELLDQADALRRQRGEADAKLALLLPALFRHHFGDPASNPKSWRITDIGSVSTLVTSGLTPRGGSSNYLKEGPLFLRSQNIQMNQLDLSDIACLPIELHREMERTHVRYGDVLLNITGASIGRVAWFDQKNCEANVNQHVCIIRPVPGVQPTFLSYYLSSPFGQTLIIAAQTGATRQGLNHENVRRIPLPVVPPKHQLRFASEVERVRALIGHAAASAAKLETLFQTLLYRAFTGELTARWREAHLREGVQEMTRLSRA